MRARVGGWLIGGSVAVWFGCMVVVIAEHDLVWLYMSVAAFVSGLILRRAAREIATSDEWSDTA